MNELLEEAVPPAQHCQLAYLSGPSFAIEVAQGKPTGLTIAAKVRQQLTVLAVSMLALPMARILCSVVEWLSARA